MTVRNNTNLSGNHERGQPPPPHFDDLTDLADGPKAIAPHKHCRCTACSNILYPAGVGVMRCRNSFGDYAKVEPCWNHVLVSVVKVRTAMVDTLLNGVDASLAARRALIVVTWECFQRSRDRAIEPEETVASEQQSNAIKSVEDFAADLRSSLLMLAATSHAFGALTRRLFPRLEVQPIQALDTGQVHPRLLMTLNLSTLSPAGEGSGVGLKDSAVNLFEPPKHIEHLGRILEFKRSQAARWENDTLKFVAEHLGVAYMTAKRSMRYHRLMEAEGLTEPFRVLRQQPKKASRWNRQVHSEEKNNADELAR